VAGRPVGRLSSGLRVGAVLLVAIALPGEAAAWELWDSGDPSKYRGVLKLWVASAGTALLAWGLVLRLLGRARSLRRVRGALLAALGVAAVTCWINFFEFHQGVYLHIGEIFHHYVGAKYFRELSYERLYDCTVVADYESGFGYPASERPVRRLGTNRVELATAVLANPEACTRHFSDQRWRSFRRDVGRFRSQLPAHHWVGVTTDRGFNPTPVWNVAASWLTNTGPPTRTQIVSLVLLDPLLLLVMWAFVGWAFGWRTLCVALIYWGTTYPSVFGWTGGAFLRQDWLAASVIGLCLLHRGRVAASGFTLTLATLLRMTPAVLVAGVVLRAAHDAWRRRSPTLTASHRRFALGCVLAFALALPVSVLVSGADAWPRFVRNTVSYFGAPSGNFVGWRTVVAYERATRMRATVDRELVDPHEPWRQARIEVFERRQAWFWLGVAGFLCALVPAMLRREDWEAAVLGVGLMVVCTQIPSYYYALLLVYAFLWERNEAIGVGLCALSAITWLIAGEFGSRDMIFTGVSLASVSFVVAATLLCLRSPRESAPVG
jgi:hypothetical protein